MARRPGWFREWSGKKEDISEHRQVPPGLDDISGMRGSGGTHIDPTDVRPTPDGTVPDHGEGLGRGAIESDLEAMPTQALVRAAQKRGVKDADRMDRGTLLEHLRIELEYD